jgi:hypothetical protein
VSPVTHCLGVVTSGEMEHVRVMIHEEGGEITCIIPTCE